MSNNAKVGGVLSIISGSFGIFWFAAFVFIAVFFSLILSGDFSYYGGSPYYGTPSSSQFLAIMVAVYVGLGLGFAAVGVLAIVGGVFALKRKHWGWALAGAIAGTFLFLPCGIPAIVFVSIGKHEFNAPPSTVVPPSPPAAPTPPTTPPAGS